MTDNEIIKAFRCCYLNEDECEECPCFKDGHCTDVGDVFNIVKQILDLINRQQAEIERLTKETMNMAITIETCQAEAIKEFAEKLKKEAYLTDHKVYAVLRDDIDNLVKEMVGEDK